MDALDSLIQATKINLGESIFFIIRREKTIQKWIISLNQFEQLFDKGIDADGQKIYTYNHADGEVYAVKTLIKKVKTGIPDDKVTFFQTGKFYKTFKILTDNKSFTITANFDLYGTNEINRWVNTEHILGLTDENMQLLIDELTKKLIEYLREVLNV